MGDTSEQGDVSVKNSLFGRREICTSETVVDASNIVRVLNKALAIHDVNSFQIDYLYRYMRGEQPILCRKKEIRPDICNRVVENHASEITQFTSGYFLGEPVTYVRRGDKDNASEEVGLLNDYMFFEDKASHDKDLATWMAICGVGYRMVLPDNDVTAGEADEAPFELDTPDPRHTFVVYSAGFGHRPVLGVRQIFRYADDTRIETINCCYTPTRYYEIVNGVVRKNEAHALGDIPIFEYRLNMSRLGSFEPAVPLLDAINTIMSNRVDGIEQFVQSFLKFKNCDLDDTDTVEKLRRMGAISIKSSRDGMDCDVEIMSSELNQQQTQTLVDYLYDQVLAICGMPTSTKGGKSTSDTGAAVFLRDGWSQCEARAKDTELLFKRSEKQFLRLVLRIIRGVRDFDLSLSEVECKFTRRQHDALLTKTQALIQMLEAGVAPEPAFATSGLFNDPMDVVLQSKPYLKKWEYHDPIEIEDEGDAE